MSATLTIIGAVLVAFSAAVVLADCLADVRPSPLWACTVLYFFSIVVVFRFALWVLS